MWPRPPPTAKGALAEQQKNWESRKQAATEPNSCAFTPSLLVREILNILTPSSEYTLEAESMEHRGIRWMGEDGMICYRGKEED